MSDSSSYALTRKKEKTKRKSEIDTFFDSESEPSMDRTVTNKNSEVAKPKPKKGQQKTNEGGGRQEKSTTKNVKDVYNVPKGNGSDDESIIGEKTQPHTIRKIRNYEYDAGSKCLKFLCAWSGYGKEEDTTQEVQSLEQHHFSDPRPEYASFIRKYMFPVFFLHILYTLFIPKKMFIFR
jgi:hypothetical protein